MIKLFYQGVIAALMVADTSAALSLLQDNQTAFLAPLAGARLEAQILYCAIKKSNLEVIKRLLSLGPQGIDVPFYNYCGDIPLSLALKEGLNEVIPTLLSKTDKNFALQMAVTQKNSSLINLLRRSFPYKAQFLRYLGLQDRHIANK